eukprot:Lithocolla_globosa_v1_NODE_1_length_16663_cov_42.954359.p5 type:complete len:364 gc:universal NODE_1_length_16663_cov_42.954359:10846-9755(-)
MKSIGEIPVDKVEKVFTDPKTGFTNPKELQKHLSKQGIKLTQMEIEHALRSVDAHTLHKPLRKTFERRRVYVDGVDDQWQADLVDLSRYKKENKGYRYLLTIIDVFSKYAWVVSLKSKTGEETAKALAKTFKTRHPNRLQTDNGTEFYNPHVKKVLKKYNINLFSTYSELKAQIVERFNRTLKTRMFKVFEARSTFKYIDVLDDMTANYNVTHHSSIKMTPTNASKKKNETKVYENLYGKERQKPHKPPQYDVGQHVRIPIQRSIFSKGTEVGWTPEIFIINGVKPTNPVTYTIKDEVGEEIQGSFYEQELNPVNESEYDKIEKIISKRTKNGVKEIYVKYLGRPASHNKWIPASHVVDIRKK